MGDGIIIFPSLDYLGFKTHLPVKSIGKTSRRLSDQRHEETWDQWIGFLGIYTGNHGFSREDHGKHRGLSGDIFPLNLNQHLKLTLMVIFLIHLVKYKSEMLNCSSISNFWTTKLVFILLCWISQSWTRDEPTIPCRNRFLTLLACLVLRNVVWWVWDYRYLLFF